MPRSKRSLDFLGSAWKFIAGSPDAQDFEIIKEKINNSLNTNNNQIVINKIIMEKINEIVNTTNYINSKLNNENDIQNDIILNVELKLGLIKEEIVNLEYALHWAKANIVNSYILSNIEVNKIQEILNKEEMPYLNIVQALEFAQIKIASNNALILYIINFPTTSEKPCKTTLIKPIKKGKTIKKITHENVLVCKNKIYEIQVSCLTFYQLTICPKKNLADITDSKCIPHLLYSRPSNCTSINNHHVPSIQEITPGLVFLNQYDGPVEINGEEIALNGSFIIHFQNASVRLQDQLFESTEISGYKPLPAVLQPVVTKKYSEELLSLQMMKELNVNNTNYIKLLETKNKFNTVIILCIPIILLAIYFLIKVKKRCLTKVATEVTELTEPIMEGNPTSSPKVIGIEDIPNHLNLTISNEDVRFLRAEELRNEKLKTQKFISKA